MTATFQPERPDELAHKVLRRAQVSKVTRTLQDRLALANVKAQNGWENMSLDAIEPKVEERLRRKRPASSNDTTSDTASTTSSRLHSSSGLDSSPLTAPMFSDELHSGGSRSVKRIRPLVLPKYTSSGAATGRRDRTASRSQTWKRTHSLPESSPISHAKHARFPSTNISTLSFISEGSTVLDDPPSPEFSEEDDADLPLHSFSLKPSTRITSSPPRTPPPPDRRMRKTHNISWSRTPRTGQEGADLLIYLANSPSADNSRTVRPSQPHPPTTPPCKSTPLPSSHMTPGMGGGNGFLGFGPHTPGTNLNFADFVNVTPSPAQAQWQRTPIASRTPGATTSSARRRLNFESPMPLHMSPIILRQDKEEDHGLHLDLGGDLRS